VFDAAGNPVGLSTPSALQVTLSPV
jgi:hypothetical protein